MTLVPDPDQAGRWNSVDRSNAGVHALIIGISEYSYLSGGSASKLASDTGGMGQLRVSALTAAKVFHWLINASEVVGASLVTCRLHLAPCREELEKVTLLTNGHYASADFATIRTAIEGWADDIFAGAQVAKPNVALFFFSGHGVEILSSPALLASDILNPRSASAASNAVAIESLLRAIKTCGIDRGLFFVDACRDAPTLARVLNITGEDVLKPQAYPPKIPDALISLQSTRSGLQSFQAPEDEATIFGRALLEGLHGLPPTHVPYDTMVSPWKLLFRNLESHVKHGVRELLCRHSALKIQSVEPYGNPYNGDMVVAQKIGVLAPASSNLQGGDLQGKALLRDELVASSSEQLLKGFESVYENDLHQTGAAGGMLVVANDLYNPAIMQDLFADKDITSLWIDTVEIIDGRTNKAASSDTLNLVGGKRQRVGDSITVWADLLVAAGAGDSVWVKAKGAGDRPSFLLHLPRDAQQPIPVRIDIGLRGNPGRGYIIEALSARLSDPGDHFAGPISEIWRKLWEAQRSELLDNLGCAGAELIESRVVEKAMRSEGGSPVGAAIAITLLLRCGAIEPLNDWPRKLAVRSPWLPDGAVLWAETLIRRYHQTRKPALRASTTGPTRLEARSEIDEFEYISEQALAPEYIEARRWFTRVGFEGLPFLAPTLRMAASQVPFWRQVLDLEILRPEERRWLKRACDAVVAATSSASEGGLFASVSHEQGVAPYLEFLKNSDNAFLNLNLGKSPNPDLEQEILDKVGSYGRQLGRVCDALDILLHHVLPLENLEPHGRKVLEDFVAQISEVNNVKAMHAKERRTDNWMASLAALRNDPS